MRNLIVVLLLAAGCGSKLVAPQPLDIDAVVKTCVMRASCLPSTSMNIGACVTTIERELTGGAFDLDGDDARQIEQEVQCVARASDCNSAFACASGKYGPSWCNAHAPTSCDGDTVVSCSGQWGLSHTDCAALGMHCVSDENGAICSDGKTCTAPSTERCDGDRLISCRGDGRETTLDCSALYPGGTCITENLVGATAAVCAPAPDSACTPASALAKCDGKVLVQCMAGRGWRLDCAKLAGHCEPDDVNAACVTDSNECDPIEGDMCAGDDLQDLQICVNGKWTTFKCSSIGLTTCTAGNATSSAPSEKCG